MQSGGQPIPPPLHVRALVDTGTDLTALSASCIRRLGVPVENRVKTHTVGGIVIVDTFMVSLSIGAAGRMPSPMLVQADLEVTCLPHPLNNFDALIGLDVLAECLLIYDGPGKQFTLAF